MLQAAVDITVNVRRKIQFTESRQLCNNGISSFKILWNDMLHGDDIYIWWKPLIVALWGVERLISFDRITVLDAFSHTVWSLKRISPEWFRWGILKLKQTAGRDSPSLHQWKSQPPRIRPLSFDHRFPAADGRCQFSYTSSSWNSFSTPHSHQVWQYILWILRIRRKYLEVEAVQAGGIRMNLVRKTCEMVPQCLLYQL